jgi:hypothetical protein
MDLRYSLIHAQRTFIIKLEYNGQQKPQHIVHKFLKNQLVKKQLFY